MDHRKHHHAIFLVAIASDYNAHIRFIDSPAESRSNDLQWRRDALSDKPTQIRWHTI